MAKYLYGETFDHPGIPNVAGNAFITLVLESPSLIFHLAHPGLSLHQLSMSEIDGQLKSLPDNVWIWRKT